MPCAFNVGTSGISDERLYGTCSMLVLVLVLVLVASLNISAASGTRSLCDCCRWTDGRMFRAGPSSVNCMFPLD